MVRGDPKLHLFNGWSRPHSTQDMTPSQHNNIRSITLQLRERGGGRREVQKGGGRGGKEREKKEEDRRKERGRK